MSSTKYISRFFQASDSNGINSLYQLLTGTKRTEREYRWEWLETWHGIGSSWVMIDPSKPVDENVVCQYSLIPTPLSYYGSEILSGKTENCMSHPELRGKRLYFPHEKKYFEEAKRTFQAFFTTTGKGAPGRVRRKLGYYPLDIWTRYYYFHTLTDSIKYQQENARLDSTKSNRLKRSVLYIVKSIYGLTSYIKMLSSTKKLSFEYRYEFFEKDKSPLSIIESFWNENAIFYDISINRSKKYLKWRVNDNPYHDYKYLLLYKEAILVGYSIFHIDDRNLLNVLDIIVKSRDSKYFKEMKNLLIQTSKNQKTRGLLCKTVFSNLSLKNTFSNFGSRKEISKKWVATKEKEGKEVHDFYGFVNKNIDTHRKSVEPSNWYITALFLEK